MTMTVTALKITRITGLSCTMTYWPPKQKKAHKNKRADWQGLGSRVLSNTNMEDKTHVEQTKVNTTVTHETPLTARVEDAEQLSSINLPHQSTALIDSCATSSCGHFQDPFQATGWVWHKIFITLFGQKAAATKQKELLHSLCKPANTIDIVPTSKSSHTLLSTSKFADANYITMLTPHAVQFYDGQTMTIKSTKLPVLSGWRNTISKLWHVPPNPNPSTPEQANNVFELKKKHIVPYYHAAVGYSAKPMWLAAIQWGFYATWPLLTERAVPKHFPEPAETA